MKALLWLLARLPFVHVITSYGRMFPKRGLLIDHGALHLVLGWKGSRPYPYETDFRQRVGLAPRMYWARLTFNAWALFGWRQVYGTNPYDQSFGPLRRQFGWPWERWRWEFARGTTPLEERHDY